MFKREAVYVGPRGLLGVSCRLQEGMEGEPAPGPARPKPTWIRIQQSVERAPGVPMALEWEETLGRLLL